MAAQTLIHFLDQCSDAPLGQIHSSELSEWVASAYSSDEAALIEWMASRVVKTPDSLQRMRVLSGSLIDQVREGGEDGVLDALLLEYGLNTQEGVLLMSLAEALLRTPDVGSQEALIRDKMTQADWLAHLGHSDSWWVNASSMGLWLSGLLLPLPRFKSQARLSLWQSLCARLSEPVIRRVVLQMMALMGDHFVLGRTMSKALERGFNSAGTSTRYSFDMLGEAALTLEDAEGYWSAYADAIRAVGKRASTAEQSSISIKLSALHPRYEMAQSERLQAELLPKLRALVTLAREQDVPLTIDAEEADRLELSLSLFEQLYRHRDCRGWGGLGLVVQAYSKRALPVVYWLRALAHEVGDVIPVRLVKGAYWDAEIKWAQQKGVTDFPVYTQKAATDLSYLYCAQVLLDLNTSGLLSPQFATHNAHTVAAVVEIAQQSGVTVGYEFQRLHGMGASLYHALSKSCDVPVRIYAPVGAHHQLLPYLVRRLLENGANSSFVHQVQDATVPVAKLSEHPLNLLRAAGEKKHNRCVLPSALFEPERVNSSGLNIQIKAQWHTFLALRAPFEQVAWQAEPIIDGQKICSDKARTVFAPYDREERVGAVTDATERQMLQALENVKNAFPAWHATDVTQRAKVLDEWADRLENNRGELYALCQREAGKTVNDAIDEVREAVDFCRYYAAQARAILSAPHSLLGASGESVEHRAQGLGPVVCISPWNFPLAIFVGQVTAALVAGNTVLAKPAGTTTLIASRAVELLLESGLPANVIAFLPGAGAVVGRTLLSDPAVAAVAFTGSMETAQAINRQLATRIAEPAVLIAETGGVNTMLVDSTALPEQVVHAALESAFTSAGQRCSALRLLLLQEECAPAIEAQLIGALKQLQVGDPRLRSTDVGPVIDAGAQQSLLAHAHQLEKEGRLLAKAPLSAWADQGCFVSPALFALDDIEDLTEEHFGPLLHVVRYPRERLGEVLNAVNRSGFGLTMGIHSRNQALIDHIVDQVCVGNVYINRNQVGAVVGAQPFGGCGLSGTGPKAGGPHYLLRLTRECAV